ncbi:MAG: hypothetical protein K0Q85_1299, partial [Caproiciproducens sp.]|nr:hypothetical protein [Caproiciproducens sp.]
MKAGTVPPELGSQRRFDEDVCGFHFFIKKNPVSGDFDCKK